MGVRLVHDKLPSDFQFIARGNVAAMIRQWRRRVDYVAGNWRRMRQALFSRYDARAGATAPKGRTMTINARPVGDLLRSWRQRRRLSQLDLACEANISTRHLSFIETGRSQPSREMLMHLAEQLEMPLRERNRLLLAAGFAPPFTERCMQDPEFAAVRKAVDLVLAGHEPFPALAIDRRWQLLAANRALTPVFDGIAGELLQPPVNVLRVSLHPTGLAPRIANLREWRTHLLARLRHQIDVTADPDLIALLEELQAYPIPDATSDISPAQQEDVGVAIPLRLITSMGLLSFLSTTTVFGTPVDITLSELAIEAFFPADAHTGEAMRQLASSQG
jgi:transcriptional regulator with XRE-family HTH domain